MYTYGLKQFFLRFPSNRSTYKKIFGCVRIKKLHKLTLVVANTKGKQEINGARSGVNTSI